MSVFDDIIEIDENGSINYSDWLEWQHIPAGIYHCPICLALDKCWFNKFLLPESAQHKKCHCILQVIPKPLPNINSWATCDLKKFTDYIFSDKYAWNGKRVLFEKLGFTKNDSQYLKAEYERQAVNKYCNGEYRLGKLDKEGQRVNINVEIVKNERNIIFTSGWMIRPKGRITNNTPLAD